MFWKGDNKLGKFAIACPECGSYVVAYNGLHGLIKRKVVCQCGRQIDVQTERMTSTICPHCNNSVIYDQGNPNPNCPVCGETIAPSDKVQMIPFKCPECGVSLEAPLGTGNYNCPICDRKIDVQR